MPERLLRLNTPRLCLKEIEESSRDEMIGCFLDENVRKTYMIPPLETKEQADRLFEHFASLSADRERFVYGIYLDGRLSGFINDCARDARSLELGYVTLPRYQNRGVMTEALTAAIAEAFRAGYQRVEAGFFEGNAASRRVMEKCGMKASGRVETVNWQGREIRTVFYEVHKEKSE